MARLTCCVAGAACVLGAIVLRAAFFTSAPPFLNPDSAGYYVPARNLVYGDGFDLGLRRTPTYPLFIAASSRSWARISRRW